MGEGYESEPLSQQAWLNAEACEFEGHARNCSPPGWAPKNPSLLTLGDARADLEPLFEQYGVDIYWAGHIHFYQRFHGALSKGKVVDQGTYNPKGVIHVCSGNGGPPSATNCNAHPKCKHCDATYSYTRLTAYNATDLLWEQVSNMDGSVIDSWVLHQEKHGAFTPVPPTPAPTPQLRGHAR